LELKIHQFNQNMGILRALKYAGLLSVASGCVIVAYSAATAFTPSPRMSEESIVKDGGKTYRLSDGRMMEYFVHGNPTATSTLIALHGANTTGNLFQLLHQWGIDNNVRIIAPSLPGFGKSEPRYNSANVPSYDLLSWAQDTSLFLQSIQIDDFYVLGTSLGGPHAAALASVFPDRARVRNVMLYVPLAPYGDLDATQPGGVYDPLNGSMLKSFGDMRSSPRKKRVIERLFFVPLLRAMSPAGGDVARSVASFWEGAFTCTTVIYQPWMFPWKTLGTEVLPCAQAPHRKVFIVSGTKDAVAPPHNQQKLAQDIVNSVLITYEGEHEYSIVHPELMVAHASVLLQGSS
jgi:pimeloyl-ACP methyl ester carboxylesterase